MIFYSDYREKLYIAPAAATNISHVSPKFLSCVGFSKCS